MAAEDAVADRVERTAPEAGGAAGEEVVDALEHFARGFISECEEKDVVGRDGVFEEIGDAVGEGAGFAAACAGEDEGFAGGRGDSGELLGVEFRLEVDGGGGGFRGVSVCGLAFELVEA